MKRLTPKPVAPLLVGLALAAGCGDKDHIPPQAPPDSPIPPQDPPDSPADSPQPHPDDTDPPPQPAPDDTGQ